MDPEPRVGGGIWLKAKKSDPHQFDGGSGQQCACCNFRWFHIKWLCPSENAHTIYKQQCQTLQGSSMDGPNLVLLSMLTHLTPHTVPSQAAQHTSCFVSFHQNNWSHQLAQCWWAFWIEIWCSSSLVGTTTFLELMLLHLHSLSHTSTPWHMLPKRAWHGLWKPNLESKKWMLLVCGNIVHLCKRLLQAQQKQALFCNGNSVCSIVLT